MANTRAVFVSLLLESNDDGVLASVPGLQGAFADGRVVPVPHHRGKKIRRGTVRAIIREVGVSVTEFMQAQDQEPR